MLCKEPLKLTSPQLPQPGAEDKYRVCPEKRLSCAEQGTELETLGFTGEPLQLGERYPCEVGGEAALIVALPCSVTWDCHPIAITELGPATPHS